MVRRAVAVAGVAVAGVLASLLASVPVAAAAQAPRDVAEHGCALTQASWTGRYQTRDGHAVRAAWSIETRFECDNPELHLDVHGRLLHGGRAVDGIDATGSCDARVDTPCVAVAGSASRTLTGRLSGLWQLRVTVHVRGADAAVMDGDGCTYDPASVTLTCEVTSRPVRLP